MIRKFATAAATSLVLGILLSATALAAGPGASECGRVAGQDAAGLAQTLGTGFGKIVSTMAPVASLNLQALFNCNP